MNKRVLGHTGIKVSEIAFGGVSIGVPYGIGVKGRDDMITEQDAINLLHSAIDGGINFFDTARMYGASESIMGKAFKGRREKVVISTKCKHIKDKSSTPLIAKKIEKTVITSLEDSLTHLQTDFVDLFMLHQADIETLENETIKETFIDLKRKGIIRAAGVSTYTVKESIMAIESGVWDVIQVPFNLMDQSQEIVFNIASEKGIAIMVRSVLFKGILTSKGKNLHPALEKVEHHLKSYRPLIRKSGADLASLAIRFALSFDQISSVLVGLDHTDYLEKTISVANGRYFDNETLRKAKELQYPDSEFLDLVKWDKMGWLT